MLVALPASGAQSKLHDAVPTLWAQLGTDCRASPPEPSEWQCSALPARKANSTWLSLASCNKSVDMFDGSTARRNKHLGLYLAASAALGIRWVLSIHSWAKSLAILLRFPRLFHFDVTSISFWYHFDVIPVPLRCHFEFTPFPLICQCKFTSNSL